jgi:hypothetical protein
MVYTFYEAQAHIDDLERDAAQHRLAQQSRGDQPTSPLFHNGLYWLGGALVWLGSRLNETVCERVQPAVTVNSSAVLSLNEAACC